MSDTIQYVSGRVRYVLDILQICVRGVSGICQVCVRDISSGMYEVQYVSGMCQTCRNYQLCVRYMFEI